MSIEYAILGLLSWRELSGYDLKKIFEESVALYWTGNNNEIYRALVDLRERGLVSVEVQPQEKLPARKVYAVTAEGRAELAAWTASAPQLPQRRHALLIQLAWADALPAQALDDLLAEYEDEVQTQAVIARAQLQPAAAGARARFLDPAGARTPREAALWRAVLENWAAFYGSELAWVRALRVELSTAHSSWLVAHSS